MSDSSNPKSSDQRDEPPAEAGDSIGGGSDSTGTGAEEALADVVPPNPSDPELEFHATDSSDDVEALTHPPPLPRKVDRSDRSPQPGSVRPLPEPASKHATAPTAKASPSSPPAAPKASASAPPPRKFPPELVADLMTRQLIALEEHEPVANVEAGMQRFRFRHLPVVTKDNKLLGIITRQDLLRAFAGTHSPDGSGTEEVVTKDTEAGAIMTRGVLTTRPNTPIVSAGKALLQKKLGCLPVVEDDDTLVGIITESDFVRLAVELLERG